MKKSILVLSILFCLIFEVIAQNSKIDSLQNVLKTVAIDTNIVSTLNELSIELYSIGNYEEALHFAENVKQSANKFIAKKSNKKSIKVLKKGLAQAYNTIGNIYSDQGLYPDALQNYFTSLKIKEQIGDKKGIASSYNNIGIVYKTQNNYTDALNSYKASLKIKKQLGDKQGIASSYNNIANIYHIQGNFSQAIENYSKSLQLFKELDFISGITFLYNNIGGVYFNQAEQEKDNKKKTILFSNARDNYNASLSLFEEISDKRGVVASLINIGTIELKQKNIPKAKEYANRALSLSKNEKSGEMLKDIYNLLAQIETTLGNYKQAFDHYKIYIQLRDSIFNEENTKKTVQMQMQFGFDKKMAADSIANAKSQELKEVEIAKQKAEIKVKKNQQYGLFGGLLLVIVFAGFMYNRFTVTRKQKQIIELQKQEVENQKEIVDEKNKEITDSIQYAKRIQNAILPPIKFVKEHLPQSFIVYKPKDIVAGDFYWLESLSAVNSSQSSVHSPLKTENCGLILFAACDCTGHGVPGAMVSVVCVNGLNRSVREHGITDPGKILDKTREIVIQEFEKSDDVVKDGMDIALCSLEFKVQSSELTEPQTSTELASSTKLNIKPETVALLQYAGANNPLWLIKPISNNLEPQTSNLELIEYKPNKQHIGKVENQKPFTTHTIELQKNDTIYIFTDGYQDQFGGENASPTEQNQSFGRGKKFKSSKLKELLLSIQDKDMNEQQKIVAQTFDQWKGNFQQIDDVCIIGVRI